MTTPNLPWDTTDPADLPQGVIAPSQAGTALQDQSQQKFTDVAASKFPAIASNTAAGSPSGGGVMGFVVSKFSQITSNVANADPATINKPDDVVNLAGNFFSGLPLVSFIGDIVAAVTGIIGGGFNTLSTFFSQLLQAGQGIPIVGPITQGIYNFFFHQAAVANSAAAAAAQAQIALDAAEEADGKITALAQGGIRTVYTSNQTWTKPAGLLKIIVLLYGGGRKGNGPGWAQEGGLPGGLIIAEIGADLLPATVAITVGAGSSGPGVASTSSFGSLIASTDSGGGILQNSSLLTLDPSVFPGKGGRSSIQGDNNYPTAGGSTALAAGGYAQTVPGANPNGGAGGSAAVTGQFLAGGGGGGGGLATNGYFSPAGNGGAGGFPGGGGGGAGRNANEAYWVPGAGAPGLVAVIEFKAAA